MQANVKAFFDEATGTISYVVYDRPGGRAAIVDPVWDYDPKSGRTGTASADALIAFVREQGLVLDWILETHAHADHLSSAQYLKQALGGRTAIGARIRQVQAVFGKLFNLEAGFAVDGSQFDHLFEDEEGFAVGDLPARALFVPGHTPADMAYEIGGAVFIGDTLFMPDIGSARCDFPGGDAAALYRSAQRLLSLPDETALFLCHDYPPAGRAPAWYTTVGQQRQDNIHLRDGIGEADFVRLRQERDATLAAPVLLLPSVQVNIRAGNLPPAEANGVTYLKIPLNAL